MQVPQVVSGLERVERYWDRAAGNFAAKLRPGEYYVTRAGEDLVTVVGSTLAVHVLDPGRRVAGMCHFALPSRADGALETFEALAYGRHALDLLLTGVQRQGARPGELRASLVGAGDLWSRSDAAQASVGFARLHLEAAGVPIEAEHLGGRRPRKVWGTLTGAAVTHLDSYSDTIRWREATYIEGLEQHGWSGDAEGDHTVGHHRVLLRHVDFLEPCSDRAAQAPISWIFGAREGLRALEDLIVEHFSLEEVELYPWLTQTLPAEAEAIARLRSDHMGFVVRLAALQSLAAMPLGASRRRLLDQLGPFLEDLRAHERTEAELLLAAYRRDGRAEPDPAVSSRRHGARSHLD